MLALDTPDDDPRWAGFVEQSQLGFLEPQTTEKQVEAFRELVRADGSRLRVVYDLSTALPHQPVATFSSFDETYDVGGARTVPASFVSEVTVRASHRRRGLLRRLMELDLAQAHERGAAMAMLTASEATIYGRFGFAPVNRRSCLNIETRRFALREPAGGRVELVDRERGAQVFDALTVAMHSTHRGEFSRPSAHQPSFTGAVDYATGEPDRAVRLCVHYPQDGAEPDGIVSFKVDPKATPTTVRARVLARTPQAELALLDFLAHVDLVERVQVWLPEDHPLPWALLDPRCLSTTQVEDDFWVRVLDVETMLGTRAWEEDGELVLGVRDPLGYCEGTWRIAVTGRRAQVSRTQEAAQAGVDVTTLAQLACAGIPPARLVAAGLVRGTAEAQHAVARLFTTHDLLAAPAGF